MDPQGFGGGVPQQEQPQWQSPWPPAAARPRRSRGRLPAAVLVIVAAVAATGVGFAVSTGQSAADAGARPASSAPAADVAARSVWRNAPADTILPPKLAREGTEVYYRAAVDRDESCTQLPAAFLKALGAAGCVRLIQATYVDATESVVATVGLVVAGGSPAQRADLFRDWTADSFARRYAVMPSTYPVKATLAAGFHNAQRIAWMSAISDDGTYIAYAVSGFADGRQGPDAAAFAKGDASELQSDSPPVQVADDLPTAVLDALTAAGKTADGGV